MSKRKLCLSIWTVTAVVWLIALIRLEFLLIRLSNSVNSNYTLFFNGFDVPFMAHVMILLTIFSLGAWLWSSFSELLTLYSKELLTI